MSKADADLVAALFDREIKESSAPVLQAGERKIGDDLGKLFVALNDAMRRAEAKARATPLMVDREQ